MPENVVGRPIDFDNLDEAKQPSEETGFAKMDTVKPEVDDETKTTNDLIEPTETGSAKADNFAVEESEEEKEDKNKLPPANELMAKEEDPNQRKLAGEAPYVTAQNPSAFTEEVDGGVVKEDGQNKKSPEPTSPKSATSTPAMPPGT